MDYHDIGVIAFQDGEIQKKAYSIWLKTRNPDRKANWIQAERELREEFILRVVNKVKANMEDSIAHHVRHSIFQGSSPPSTVPTSDPSARHCLTPEKISMRRRRTNLQVFDELTLHEACVRRETDQ